MDTEGIALHFTPGAIEQIADFATRVNERTENIGARRLHTVLERLLDEALFDAPDRGGSAEVFDAARVRARLADIAGDRELSRFIL
jgi:ATP-dependent HslUV protease ATP-binding subunit HslU